MANNVNYFEVRFKASFSGMPKLIFALQTDYATLLCTNRCLVFGRMVGLVSITGSPA